MMGDFLCLSDEIDIYIKPEEIYCTHLLTSVEVSELDNSSRRIGVSEKQRIFVNTNGPISGAVTISVGSMEEVGMVPVHQPYGSL